MAKLEGIGFKSWALASAAFIASALPAAAQEATQQFNIPPQSLASALNEFGRQSGRDILFSTEVAVGKQSPGVQGAYTPEAALRALLAGTGLEFRASGDRTFLVQAHNASPTQLGAADSGAEEEIVVTGTNIRGSETASPERQFSRADIERSGYSNTTDFLLSVPQNSGGGVQPYNTNTLGLGGDGSGSAAINLRGLGSDSTLVLVNGRRPGAAGVSTSYVDISLIPITAVERMDVVLDGASAIYGSDAVAGVLNVVLRRDFDGAETSLRLGAADDGGEEVRAAQTLGRSWGSGNVLLSYEHFNRENIRGADKDFIDPRTDPFDILFAEERNSLFLSGSQRLTDALELSFFSLASARTTEGFGAVLAGSGGSIVQHSFSESDTLQYTNSLSLLVDLGSAWTLDLGVTAGRNRRDGITEVLDPPPLDTITSRAENSSRVLDVVASGPLIALPAGDVRIALGGQYRDERYSSRNDSNPSRLPDLSRESFAFFGEADIPIFASHTTDAALLNLNVSGRYEEYDAFGSTFNPRVGLTFRPLEDLTLTATWGTSFKAPNFQSLDETGNQQLAFPIFNPASPTFTTGVLFLFGGNAELTPETAETWSVGGEFSPSSIPGLRLQANYFSVDYQDRVGSLNGQRFSAFDAFTHLDFFSPVLDLAPDPLVVADYYSLPSTFAFIPASSVEGILDLRSKNLGSTVVSGMDFRIEAHSDNLYFSLDGAYLFEFENRLASGSPQFDVVGTIFNQPRFRARAWFGYQSERWDVGTAVNFISTEENTTVTPSEDIDSWTTVDFSSQLHLDSVDLQLSVANVFNLDPPFARPRDVFAAGAFDANNHNPLGRIIAISLSKRW